jgi:hypothetical protein
MAAVHSLLLTQRDDPPPAVACHLLSIQCGLYCHPPCSKFIVSLLRYALHRVAHHHEAAHRASR